MTQQSRASVTTSGGVTVPFGATASVTLSSEAAAELERFYAEQRDRALGRFRPHGEPDLVCYPDSGPHPDPNLVHVLNELTGQSTVVFRGSAPDDSKSAVLRAAAQYFAASPALAEGDAGQAAEPERSKLAEQIAETIANEGFLLTATPNAVVTLEEYGPREGTSIPIGGTVKDGSRGFWFQAALDVRITHDNRTA